MNHRARTSSKTSVVLNAFSAEALAEAGEEARGPSAAEIAVAAPAAASEATTADAAMRSERLSFR